MDTEKTHIRHCILHYFRAGKTSAETHRVICAIEGEHVVSETTCREWFRRFKTGDFDLNDKPRSGRPLETDEEELQALLHENPAQSTRELAAQLGVSQTAVVRHLKALGKVQKAGRWVAHKLSEEAIISRLNICDSLLARHNRKSFLHNIVTGDQKWIIYDNPQRKRQWLDPGEPARATPRKDMRCGKVMLCIWWDQKGVLYYELLKRKETITADRYSTQLTKLAEEIDKKRPWNGKGRRKVILQHDNASPHVARASRDTITKLGWEILPHPAYSPDLAPSDYHLFRSMQHELEGRQFAEMAEVRKWVDEFIDSKKEFFFYRGIHMLPERWAKVQQNHGHYFD